MTLLYLLSLEFRYRAIQYERSDTTQLLGLSGGEQSYDECEDEPEQRDQAMSEETDDKWKRLYFLAKDAVPSERYDVYYFHNNAMSSFCCGSLEVLLSRSS